jgi:hypothetical protein
VPDTTGSADTSKYSVVLVDKNNKIAGYSTYDIVRVDGTPTTVYPQAVLSWNLMSLPVRVPDGSLSAVYPTAISPAYLYNHAYVSSDSVWPMAGFWLKFDSAQTVTLPGSSNLSDTAEVGAGWSIIGALTEPIPTALVVQNPPAIVVSNYFYYDTSYKIATKLEPGRGYWVKTSAAGELRMTYTGWPSKSTAVAGADVPGTFSSLLVSDARGRHQTLRFGVQQAGFRPERFELPPVPPEGSFDVRFASQRLVEASAAGAVGVRWPILVQADGGPIRVTAELSAEAGARYALEYADGQNSRRVNISSGTTVEVPAGSSLALVVIAGAVIPTEYALEQNYPNPFNPVTMIRYSLPSAGHVKLTVFNLLGQEVAVLVNAMEEAGYKSVAFDASNLPSGVYTYRITAGRYTESRRMMLVK